MVSRLPRHTGRALLVSHRYNNTAAARFILSYLLRARVQASRNKTTHV